MQVTHEAAHEHTFSRHVTGAYSVATPCHWRRQQCTHREGNGDKVADVSMGQPARAITQPLTITEQWSIGDGGSPPAAMASKVETWIAQTFGAASSMCTVMATKPTVADTAT